MSGTPSEMATSELPISEAGDTEATGTVTPAPEPSPKVATFPPYPPYLTEPVPPSVADAIIAGHDLRRKHKSIPRKPLRPLPKPARPRGPKATDVKMSRRALRAHARCLRKHGAILTDRLERMSKPHRRNIIYMWREHAFSLPPETIARMRAMLDADEPFKPDQAYEYFINLKNTKKKATATARVNEIKKDILAMCGEKRFVWARNATVAFARGIQQRLSRPGRYSLADGMLRLSNIVLNDICGYMHMRAPSRRSTHPKAKFMLEMADKVAVWIDEILSESNDRMLMMDFDEDDDILALYKGAGDDAGFLDDFDKMSDDDFSGAHRLLQKPPQAYKRFSGDMKTAFEILTNAMDSTDAGNLVSHGKFKQTYREAANALRKATDLKATEYSTDLATDIKRKLRNLIIDITPRKVTGSMKDMLQICSNYLAQNAEFNKNKGPAFKKLVNLMKIRGNDKMYEKDKVKRTYAEAATELERAKALDTDHDDPNLSQAIHTDMSKLARGSVPNEMKDEMSDTVDLCSKYLSQKAVDDNERGPAFDHLIKELNKVGHETFSAYPALSTKNAAAYILASAPGLLNVSPDPSTAEEFKTALHKAVDTFTPKKMDEEMKEVIDRCGDYLSGFIRDRGPAMDILTKMLKNNPKNVFATRNDYTMDYETAADEIINAPTLVPYLPVKDIADEGQANLEKDMKSVEVLPKLKLPVQTLIKDAARYLSQPVAMRSGAAGDKYPMNFLAAVNKSLGSKPLYKYKSYGQTYSEAGDELEVAGPMESVMGLTSNMNLQSLTRLISEAHLSQTKLDKNKTTKELSALKRREKSVEKLTESTLNLSAEIASEMNRGVPTKLAPSIAEGLKSTIPKAAKHLAKIGTGKGKALQYVVDLMKSRGKDKLGKLQGYDQTYKDGARRIEHAPSLATEKVDKAAYDTVKGKLTQMTKDKPVDNFAALIPGVIDESAKFLAAPVPETAAEKRQILGDLMGREEKKILSEDGPYKISYEAAGDEIQHAPVGVTTAHDEAKNKEIITKIEEVIPDKRMATVLKDTATEGAAHLANVVEGRGQALKIIQESLKNEKNKEFIDVGAFKKNHEQVANMLEEAPNLSSDKPSPVILEHVEHKLNVLPKNVPRNKPLAKEHMADATKIAAEYIASQATKGSGLNAQQLAKLEEAGFNAEAKVAADEKRLAKVKAGPSIPIDDDSKGGRGKAQEGGGWGTSLAASIFGSTVLPDSTKPQDPSSVVLGPDGKALGRLGPDGTPSGVVVRPDGTVLSPDGKVLGKLGPNGTIVGPDGKVFARIGPNGELLGPDGKALGPGGIILGPDGTVLSPDGKVLGVLGPDGTVLGPDGKVLGRLGPDGKLLSPDGKVLSSGGVVVRPDGTVLSPDGKVLGKLGPNGTIVGPDGKVFARIGPNGELLGPDGKALGPGGIILGPDGTVLSPDGKVLGVLGPDGTILGPDGKVLGRLGPDGKLLSPDGKVLGSGGVVVRPDGTVLSPDGKVLGKLGPNGTIVGPDGKVFARIGPNGELLGPDGKALGPGSIILGPDGTVLSPDGKVLGVLGPDGTVLGPDGKVLGRLGPDGKLLSPDGKVLGSGGVVVRPDGTVLSPDGKVLGKLGPNGTIVGPDGKVFARIGPNGELLGPDGKALGPGGIILGPDGTVLSPDGKVLGVLGPDGTVLGPDGKVLGRLGPDGKLLSPDGKVLGSGGVVVRPDGTVLSPDGKVLGKLGPNGTIVGPDGKVFARIGPNGELLGPDGKALGPGGIILGPDGTVLSPDGKVLGVLGPDGTILGPDGKVLGRLGPDGKLLSPDGKVLGSGGVVVRPDGTVLSPDGKVLGKLGPNGTIVGPDGKVFARIGPNGELLGPDGKALGPGGIILGPDGTVLSPDGKVLGVLGPDGTVLGPDGKVLGRLGPDGKLLSPDGKVLGSGGVVVRPDGTVLSPDGKVLGKLGPNGTIVGPDGKVFARIGPNGELLGPDGKALGPGGIILGPDGTVLSPDGKVLGVLGPDGTVLGPDGKVLGRLGPDGKLLSSDGKVLSSGGVVVRPDGTVLSPDGKVLGKLGPNGTIVGPDGKVFARIGPNGELLGPDGKALGPGGIILGPDGTVLSPDGKVLGVLGPDGTVLGPDGKVLGRLGPDGKLLSPDGKVLGSGGVVVRPDGTVLSPDGKVLGKLGPNGTIVGPDGKVFARIGPNGELLGPDGKALGPGGIILGPDGTVLSPDGKVLGVLGPDGTVLGPDGKVLGRLGPDGKLLSPDGKVLGSGGVVVRPDGTVLSPDGKVLGKLGPNGTIVGPDGKVFARIGPNGELLGPDGKALGPGGIILGPDGTVLSPDGKVLGVLGPDGTVLGPDGKVLGRLGPDGVLLSSGGEKKSTRRAGPSKYRGGALGADYDPEHEAALDILHQELKAHGPKVFYQQPQTTLTHDQASEWLAKPILQKVDKAVKDSSDTSRLHKKFERKLNAIVASKTPPELADCMQDVVIEGARRLSECFVSTSYTSLVNEALITEMQKRGNEILTEVDKTPETYFFATQRIKRADTLAVPQPCYPIANEITKKLDDVIRTRPMPRKLNTAIKDSIKEAANFLSVNVTKPDDYIAAYIALLDEMEAAGDASLIEGEIPKTNKEAADYLKNLTSFEDKIKQPNPTLQVETENKLKTLMSEVTPSGYSPSVMDNVIAESTGLLVSYVMSQAEKTETLKVLAQEMKKTGNSVLLTHGTIRRTFDDGANLLDGITADQLKVPPADPVVTRKIQLKLDNLMRTTTPEKYIEIMDGINNLSMFSDVIEDTTTYLATRFLEPRVIKICKCYKNVFVQCELRCDDTLRRTAWPCCTCTRHLSVQALQDLAPGQSLRMSHDNSRVVGPDVEICVKTCPKRCKISTRENPDAANACPTKDPTTNCKLHGTVPSYLLYSTSLKRYDDESFELTSASSSNSLSPLPYTPVSSSSRIHLSERSSPLNSFLHDIHLDSAQFFEQQQEQLQFFEKDKQIQQVKETSPTFLSPASTYNLDTSLTHQPKSSYQSQLYPSPNFSNIHMSETSKISQAKSGYSSRTPIISTDQTADWYAMMVSLMWNLQSWRDWIQEIVDHALAYQHNPNITREEHTDTWSTFRKRVSTEALQWRQYGEFSRQLTTRLHLRYRDKEIVSPKRATVKTKTYIECQEEMLDIIQMFNKWTHWLTVVVKETDLLEKVAGTDVPLHHMRWNRFKKKIEEYSKDWTKYIMYLKVSWEQKYSAVIADYLPGWNKSGPVWVVSACGAVPSGAIAAGVYDGEVIWVARTTHGCAVLPAALYPSKHCCMVYAEGAVYRYAKYQVMCNAEVRWVAWRGGSVSQRAVRVGTGVHLGRVHYHGNHLLGAVHEPHYRCHVVIFGRPFAFNCYELLMLADEGVGDH